MQFDSQSVNLSRYQMIPRTLVFIKKQEKYLLIYKNKPESFGFNKMNGVGGHIEKGEEPYESAQREIVEETGLAVGGLDLTAILFIDINSSPGILVFVFKADFLEGKIEHSDEGELCWMSLDEIKNSSNVVADIPELIEACETHKAGARPQIIKYIYDDLGILRIVKHLW